MRSSTRTGAVNGDVAVFPPLGYNRFMGTDAERPKVGLVLSGGSARGMAHLGILAMLEEHGIPIDLIVGASIGSMVGGYYARGFRLQDLMGMLKHFRIRSVLDLSKPWFRILSLDKARALLEKDLNHTDIADLKIPLYILASDIRSLEMVVIERGDLANAMLASSAFPGLFEPVEHEGRLLFDGGIMNRLMVEIARKRGADIVVYADVSMFTTLNSSKTARWLYGILLRHVKSKRHTLERKLSRVNLRYMIFRALCVVLDHGHQYAEFKQHPPDFIIVPEVKGIRPLQFGRFEESYGLGRNAALRVADALRESVFGT
jgi:predicted acylesterase/phospholipase RssA